MNTLLFYLSYPFVRYALIAGLLISFCSSLLGVTLVTRRMSFIGDSLSHSAFTLAALSGILGLSNDFIITFIGTVIVTLYLLNGKKKDDSSLAMISVSTLAIGYVVINLFSKSANMSADVCTTLFGSTSILTLKPITVIICAILSIIVSIVFILYYHKIFSVTFDEAFAYTSGVNVNKINILISVIVAAIIVLSMYLVGSLLITALIIFPALCAMALFDNFKAVTIFSIIISVICTLSGIVISIFMGTPVGSTIVIINLVIYGICRLIKIFKQKLNNI